jgi:hypothetical protein
MKNEKKVNEKVVARKQAREAWLNDTRTITALVKWANGDGSKYVEDYLSKLENAPTLRKLCNVKNVITPLLNWTNAKANESTLLTKMETSEFVHCYAFIHRCGQMAKK